MQDTGFTQSKALLRSEMQSGMPWFGVWELLLANPKEVPGMALIN